jgi:hypothetical protein
MADEWRQVADAPPRIRLAPTGFFRGVGLIAFGIVLLCFIPLILLGWIGVFAISAGGSALGMVFVLVLGPFALIMGLRQRSGWLELELGADVIAVTTGVLGRAAATTNIPRPPRGLPLSAIVRCTVTNAVRHYYLEVHVGLPHPRSRSVAAWTLRSRRSSRSRRWSSAGAAASRRCRIRSPGC